MSDDTPDVMVQSLVVRPDEMLEITFVEARDTTEKAGLIKSVVFDPSLLRKEDLDDVFDTLADFADTALRHIRTGETLGGR